MSQKRRHRGHTNRHNSASAHPNRTNAIIDAAAAHYRAGHLQKAEIAFRKVLETRPRNPDVLNSLAQIVYRDGRPGEAIPLIERAIAIKARPEYFYSLGIAFRALGRSEEAISAFRRAISMRRNYVEAYASLVELKPFEEGDVDIEALEKLLSDHSISPEDATRLHFALAKVRDDCGDYDKSFHHLETANKLKRATLDYDIALEEALVERIIGVFTRRTVRKQDRGSTGAARFLGSLIRSRHPPQDNESENLIFIVGMPRSGTTLIEQILATHSRTQGVGERNELKDLVALKLSSFSPTGKNFPDAIADISSSDLKELGKDFTDSMRRLAPAAHVIVDKTPMNFLFLGIIRMLWPSAKVIHCLRDPVANCFSCYTKLFTGDQKFSYDLVELGRYYRNSERLMGHWHKVLPGFILDVHYENVVNDLRNETRKILEFCDLPWEERCLLFHETERPVLTASAMQVRKPIFSSALTHWKHYQNHLTPLLESLGRP